MTGPREFIYNLLREHLSEHLAFALSGRACAEWGEAETKMYGTLGQESFLEFLNAKRKDTDKITVILRIDGE